MKKEIILPVVRHSLQLVGGILVAKGILDESTSGQLIDLTVTAIGSVISIVSLIWMLKAKKKAVESVDIK